METTAALRCAPGASAAAVVAHNENIIIVVVAAIAATTTTIVDIIVMAIGSRLITTGRYEGCDECHGRHHGGRMRIVGAIGSARKECPILLSSSFGAPLDLLGLPSSSSSSSSAAGGRSMKRRWVFLFGRWSLMVSQDGRLWCWRSAPRDMSSYITTEIKEIHKILSAHAWTYNSRSNSSRAFSSSNTTPETKSLAGQAKLDFNQERTVCLGE